MRLTSPVAGAISELMKSWMMILTVVATGLGGALGASAPEEVIRSAVKATEALGEKVVMGNHKVAVDRMYPRWKQRMAKRKGGVAELERELAGIGEIMARNGMSLKSFKTVGEPKSYEVWPGKEVDGEPVFTKWVVLVPTVTRLRYMQEGQRRPEELDLYGFQVAIADKGSDDWTFISGSDISVADLRSLFTSLPANLELPEVKREMAD